MRSFFHQSKAFSLLVLGTILTILPSFTSKPGGEGFEIYLNKKLVVQKFGGDIKNISTIELDQAALNGELTVKYFHCGRVGKERHITIKNDQNKVLKTFRYPDGSSTNTAMLCRVNEIAGLQKATNNKQMKLYYSSTEIPDGRQLASLQIVSANTAKR